MPPMPPPKSGAKSAIDYLSGDAAGGDDASPLHGQIADLVNQYGLDAVQQALDECAAGGESSEPAGETGPEE